MFTARFGDGWGTTGDGFVADDAPALIAAIRRWIDDPHWRAQRRQAARDRWQACSDRSAVLDRIVRTAAALPAP